MSNDKVFLRDTESGLTALLPISYLRLFPNLVEVNTDKPVEPDLHKPKSARKKDEEDPMIFDGDE